MTASRVGEPSLVDAATPAPPFTQCPPVGADSSCGLLVQITDSGAVVLGDPTQGPYDSIEDTLIGVENDSSRSVGALALTSSTDLFGFDGDGICTYGVGACGATGYEGPNTSFSDISPDSTSGVVNFPAGLAPGAHTYFSLEEALSTSNVSTGTGQSQVTVYEVGQAPNPREPVQDCSSGQPINCATGDFWHTFDDLSVPGRGVAIDLRRSYSAFAHAVDGPFGFGWSSSYGMSLSFDGAGDVTVNQENGSTIGFTPNGSGYTAPSRVMASLVRNGDGTFTLTDLHGGVTHTFSATGLLLSEGDRNGNLTTLTYVGSTLASVTDPAGRVLSLTTDANGHVTAATDPAGRRVTYAYDGAGNLTSMTDVTGGTWTYAYDGSHQLVTMTDPRGGVVTNVYDGAGRVTSQTDPAGRTTTFAYSGDPSTSSGSTTTITDPLARVSTESYQQFQLLSVTRGSGTTQAATTTYSYDPFTLDLASVTDPNGHTRTYAWDRQGNMLRATDALGRTTTTTWTGLNEVASVTDPAGNTTTYAYDTAGNLAATYRSVDSSTTAVTTFSEGGRPGDITSIVDPDGKTWTMSYDAAGDLTAQTDPLGDTTTYGYDAIGRRTSVVSPRGNTTGGNPAAHTTTFQYDAYGDLTKVTDPLGNASAFQYDADHEQTSTTDPNGRATTIQYDADGEPTMVHRADGTSVAYGYDADGDQTKVTDAGGHATTYAYDVLDRLVTTTDPLGRATTYGYDPAGNRTQITNASGTTTLTYDNAGELVGQSYSNPATHAVSYAYTADGQRSTMTDGTGTSTYAYDGMNRLTAETNGAGQTTGYGYDLVGHLTALTYPNGQRVTRGYDAAGRLTSITDWAGHVTTVAADADGNVVSEAYANGVKASTSYDASDEVSSISDTAPGGATLASLAYTRDANHQLTSTTSTGLSQSAQSYSYTQLEQLGTVNGSPYAYDASGDLTTMTDGASLTYDAAGQATSYTPSGGSAVSLTYDGVGSRTTGPAAGGATGSYAYDQAGRLSAATVTGTGGGSTNAASLVAGGEYHSLAVDGTGTVWAWGYNANGQLGDGTTTSRTTPVRVTGAPAANAVAAGSLSSYALARSGTVSAWGYNVYGQLGNGTTTSSASPVTVTGLSGVTDIAAGNYHALAVRSDGTVAAWGLNNAGQLGDGTTVNRSTPVTVKGLSGVVQVAAGGLPGYAGQSVALKSDGTVWTWGYGKSGQLGLGVAGSTPTPTKVAGLPSIVQVAASGDNTYALAGDGTLWAWGDDSYGQIGNTAAAHTQTTPMKVSISAVTSVGAGGTHALALTSDGTAWAWGNDNTGQLGDGGACGKTCSHPVKVSGLTGAAALTGGYVHSLAVLTDGTMRSWGRNAEGELGDGTTTVRSTPVPVAGLTGITPSSLVRDSYAYDGDGLRASRTSGSVTQHFAWGRFGGTPLLLTDGSTSYVYDDGGQPVEQIDASGTPLYYQHDAYGSTRMLTDANGAVAATFSYDPYGRLTSHTGSADTPLRWNAQYQDVDTGLYYLRARYYDPLTAQFLTRDPAEMLTHTPYAYASGNPLAYSDPSGLCNANPFSGSFWTDGNCISDAAGAVWSGVTDLWNGIVSHASEISAASATLAVVLAPVPGVAEVLGAVAVVTGAIATADDVSHGEYLQAALDALGTLIGGAGLYNDVRAAMAMRAAQEAWDAGEAVLTLAKSAASAEEIGAMLDKVSAAIADLSLLVPKPCE